MVLQTLMCALAPPVNSSAQTTLAVLCAPVTRVTATTESVTGTEINHIVWVSLF